MSEATSHAPPIGQENTLGTAGLCALFFHEHKATRSRLPAGDGWRVKSWAIFKEPSMNPADKRLAVMVDKRLLMKKKDRHADSDWTLKGEFTPDRLKRLAMRIHPCDTL